jgi:hypothetical protein
MDYPDEILEEHQLSLNQFVTVAQHLSSEGEGLNSEAFIRFVLAGRYPNSVSTNSSRVFINSGQSASLPADAPLQMYSDVDSVIGITRDLPYTLPMAIFPLASFRDTLTQDVHIKYPLCPVTTPVSGIIEFLFEYKSKAATLVCRHAPTPQDPEHGSRESGPAPHRTHFLSWALRAG